MAMAYQFHDSREEFAKGQAVIKERGQSEPASNNFCTQATVRILEVTDRLSESVDRLYDRIDVVLSPNPAGIMSAISEDRPEMSINAIRMNEHADYLERLVQKVNDMIVRVEL